MPVLSWLFVAGRSHCPEEQQHSCHRPLDSPDVGPSSDKPRSALVSTSPASYDSPSDPALRANPFPEVTDPICRLPLPTLFYRLEAVHLGDLLRIWVRPAVKFTLTPSDFQGPTGVHRTAQDPRCFTEANVPISEQVNSRDYAPYKEKRTLPGTPADVSEFVCVAALDA